MRSIEKVLYPRAFNSKYIRVHSLFEEELKAILEKSGHKPEFWPKYRQRLRHLDERKTKCILKQDWFEKLKHEDELYSIKIKDEKNIRILFAFIAYKNIEYAILLYPFEEKEKKKKKSSYEAAKPVARERLKEIRV